MDEIGNLLKETRESSGVSIDEVCKDLDIENHLEIENIESGCIGLFKDFYYLKNLIFIYSKYLGLDETKMVDKFNEHLFEYTSKIPIERIEKEVNEIKKGEEEKVVSPYLVEKTINYKKYYVILSVLTILLVAVSIWWASNLISSEAITTSVVFKEKGEY